MRGYVPQRQMLPVIASSMSSSLGFGFSRSNTAALISWPDWQYPHCGTSSSSQARCSGLLKSGDKPSIVVTAFPSARETGATHERTASPLICTVQAPHCAMPQPYLVPVSPSCSRITHSNGVDGSTSRSPRLPFTEKLIIEALLSFLLSKMLI